MSTIFEVSKGTSWRDDLQYARFRGAYFHCESNSRESGRRIVEHQFPKKDTPYAEDMGRHAREFTVRGYCIVYPSQRDDQLFTVDYRTVRNALIAALEAEGPGELQLPTQPPQQVVCPRYRMMEEERFGGYVAFDMTFQEYGLEPLFDVGQEDTASTVSNSAADVREQVGRSLAPANPSIGTGIER